MPHVSAPIFDEGGAVWNVKSDKYVGPNYTNWSQKIQEAINDAQASGRGGIVYLPPGEYECPTQLQITSPDVTIQGASNFRNSQGSLIAYTGGAAAIRIQVSGPTNDERGRVALRNLMILKGTGSTAATGVDCRDSKMLDFEFVSVSGFETGFLADNSYFTTWRRCTVQGRAATPWYGIKCHGNFNANVVKNCEFIGAGTGYAGTPIKITNPTGNNPTPPGGIFYHASTGSVIRDCEFSGSVPQNSFAIELGGGCQGFEVTGNRVESIGLGLIKQDDAAFGLTIHGNNVAGSSSSPVPHGIQIAGGGVDIGLNTFSATVQAIRLMPTARRITIAFQEILPPLPSGAIALFNEAFEAIRLPPLQNAVFIMSGKATAKLIGAGVQASDFEFLPQSSVAFFSIRTDEGHTATFTVNTALRSGSAYQYVATAGSNCVLTVVNSTMFSIQVLGGSNKNYTLTYNAGVNTAEFSGGLPLSGTPSFLRYIIHQF